MAMISVIISTFGDFNKWNPIAQRAVQSVMNQTVEAEIIRIHGTTLAGARNEGAAKAKGDWLIFLDADDELDPRYVEAMEFAVMADKVISRHRHVYQPSTVEFNDKGQVGEPDMIPTYPLLQRNYLIIGSMVSKKLFDATEGFDQNLPALEDWEFWLQCDKIGAVVGKCPEAVYRIHFSSDSRNTTNQHGQCVVTIRDRYR